MKKTKFPKLYHKGKTGAMVQWCVWIEGDTIYTEHGQVGGKLQITPGVKCEAKNVGKANATTPESQAVAEARAMWVFKVERKYSETQEDAQIELFLPMLSKTFKDLKKPKEKWGHGIKYPCDVQPKLDGVRCMAYWVEDEIYLGTRAGKEWVAPRHIKEELERYMPREMVLDGELYIHNTLFEDLSSWTKKIYPETADLEYHVFDMALDEKGANLPWRQRRENVKAFFKKFASQIKMLRMVETIEGVKSRDAVLALEDHFVEQGYEGCMARNLDDKYEFGAHHETCIQKVKSSVDSEYKVVSFMNGVGKFAKSVIWWCVTQDGKQFKVTPKTTQKKREQLLREAKQHVGEWLKVRYQNLTEDGIPRFPRGIGFRDEKDM
jgi:ATP-dependent DNA ligase